jgi:hypothetical protein
LVGEGRVREKKYSFMHQIMCVNFESALEFKGGGFIFSDLPTIKQ